MVVLWFNMMEIWWMWSSYNRTFKGSTWASIYLETFAWGHLVVGSMMSSSWPSDPNLWVSEPHVLRCENVKLSIMNQCRQCERFRFPAKQLLVGSNGALTDCDQNPPTLKMVTVQIGNSWKHMGLLFSFSIPTMGGRKSRPMKFMKESSGPSQLHTSQTGVWFQYLDDQLDEHKPLLGISPLAITMVRYATWGYKLSSDNSPSNRLTT